MNLLARLADKVRKKINGWRIEYHVDRVYNGPVELEGYHVHKAYNLTRANFPEDSSKMSYVIQAGLDSMGWGKDTEEYLERKYQEHLASRRAEAESD